jgi:hypothetical protein
VLRAGNIGHELDSAAHRHGDILVTQQLELGLREVSVVAT